MDNSEDPTLNYSTSIKEVVNLRGLFLDILKKYL